MVAASSCVSHFQWRHLACATEINSNQLHNSFMMVPLESISLHLHFAHLPGDCPMSMNIYYYHHYHVETKCLKSESISIHTISNVANVHIFLTFTDNSLTFESNEKRGTVLAPGIFIECDRPELVTLLVATARRSVGIVRQVSRILKRIIFISSAVNLIVLNTFIHLIKIIFQILLNERNNKCVYHATICPSSN